MSSLNKFQPKHPARLSLVPSAYEKSQITQIRLHLHIPKSYIQEPVISQLISVHGLIVNITKAMLGSNTNGEGYFDLVLKGTITQISSGLAYLESLNIKIEGKPNTDGDGWYC